MQLGAVFPQTEIGADPAAIRAYAQAVEAMGYAHLLAFDHVVGANVDTPERRDRRWPYTVDSPFHEPFVLFGFLAAATQRLELVTGVIILPQRQTVLVAKQAAAVDVLSAGRLRLGVGLGWNEVEYGALGANFHTRGRRIAEQVEVLRALWTQPRVTFAGRWHRIDDAGLNPLPVQRPIPLWMGGSAEPVLRRVGRLADGWVLAGPPGPDTAAQWDRVKEHARRVGRDPAAVGLEGGVRLRDSGPDEWRRQRDAWRAIGATHLSVNTMGAGCRTPDEHVAALQRVHDALAQ